MTGTPPNIGTLTPVLDEFNTNTNILNIAEGFIEVTARMDFWRFMLEGDLVELILDGNETAPLGTQVVQRVGPTEFKIDPFKIAKSQLTVGNHTLQYKTTEERTPEVGRSLLLNFKVINDLDAVGLKLDITSGAAGFSDSFTNLLPANIAVVRGKPGTRWHARGQGVVQIYEAFGADNTVIEIDPDGTCPITLVKIDQLDIGTARAMLAGDALSITKENSTEVLLAQPVNFGVYTPVTGDASSKFTSYSYNNIGLADGRTQTIFSIKLANSLAGEKVNVTMDNTLGFHVKNLEVNTAARAIIDRHEVDIVDNTAEFGITSSQSGKFNIYISSTYDDTEFSQEIEFVDLR